mgnify:FL=1|jgi:hypothetical protein|tara:strand:+ start:927 stop:1211 length:285 start_codon:yes stop_codon:yes gene_type:complete
MTILELMERVNTRDTKLVIAWVKDAFNAIQSTQRAGGKARVKKMDITVNTRDYNLPNDVISVKSVSILDTDDDNKYKRIRRIIDKPIVTEDTNP